MIRQISRALVAGGLMALTASIARPAHVNGASVSPAGEPHFGFIQVSPGVRLRYAEMGDPAGDPIILLHGYSDSWYSWSRVLPALSRTHRVFALDQRGHGGSDQPAGGYEMTRLAADVIAFMDSLGLGRATIVGHSMGTLVAQQVALQVPERVSRLALLAPFPQLRGIPGMIEFRDAVQALSDPVPDEWAREFQLSTLHVPVPPDFLEEVVRTSLRLPARVWRELMDGMLAIEPATGLGRLNIPTLLLWGELDAIVPRAALEQMAGLVPGSAVVIYRETGHAPHWERPGEVVRDLARFLAGEVTS